MSNRPVRQCADGSAVAGNAPAKWSVIQSGFTLIEVLVALAVFSIAVLALLRLQALSIRTTSDLDRRIVAQIVVHNMMVDILTDPKPPALGKHIVAVDNGGYHWTVHETVARIDVPGIVQVELVSEGGGPTPVRASLVFLDSVT